MVSRFPAFPVFPPPFRSTKRASSAAHHPDPHTVILKVTKAVGLALQHFHLGVKAFGDAVIAGEAPHGGDLHRPGGQGLPQRHQLRQAAVAQLVEL